jgi:cysteine-rich repeat protein
MGSSRLDALRAVSIVLPMVAFVACTAASDGDSDSTESAQNAVICGNGVRETGEQCDDGNTSSLDGCSKTCGFEQVHRLNALELMFSTDSFCTANALGGAIKGVAQGQLQDALKGAVADGSISVLLPFFNLSDLTGQNATGVTIGSFIAEPAPGGGVDSWYSPNPASLTPEGEPLASIGASITNGALAAGPGNIAFSINLGSEPVDVRVSDARMKAQIGASSAPTASAGTSPGHLASENLDPALTSFATTSGGQLCGNISASSLAAVPVPSQLTSGSTSCTQGYTTQNSMLDVIVGGCKVFFITALGATQPDKADSTAPAAGAGAPYTLQTNSSRKVTGCKDKSGASVDLDACLTAATYSTAFKFTTQRVIAR